MNKINKRIIGLTVLALSALTTVTTYGQELELSAGGGFSGLSKNNTNLTDGNTFGISVSYMHPLNQSWKIGLGGEFGFYTLSKKLDTYQGSYMAVDPEGQDFEFRYRISDYAEDLKGSYIGIPVKVQYEGLRIGISKFSIYASAGLKYQLYSKVKSTQRLGNLSTSGYYQQWDAELHNPADAGFGDFGSRSLERKFKLESGLFALGEVGVKYALSKHQSLYLGIYGDYDLLSSGSGSHPLVAYRSQQKEHLDIKSVLDSDSDKYKLRMFTLGIKLKYAIGL